MDALTKLVIRARQWRVSNTRRKQTTGDLRVQPGFSAAPGIDELNGGPGLVATDMMATTDTSDPLTTTGLVPIGRPATQNDSSTGD